MKKKYITPLCLAHAIQISEQILTASDLKFKGKNAALDNRDTEIFIPGATKINDEPEEAQHGWIEID